MEPPYEEYEPTPLERLGQDLSNVLREVEEVNRNLSDLESSIAGQIGNIEKHLEELRSEIKSSSKSLEEPVERIWSRVGDGLLDISKEVESLHYELRELLTDISSLGHCLEAALVQPRHNYHPWFLLLAALLGVLVYRLW